MPDPSKLRLGREALAWHLDYLSWLLDQRTWLAGEKLTVADLVAASHILPADYCGLVPWSSFAPVRDWYARIKSRPAFRPLLTERIPGYAPAAHFDNPDF